MSERREDESPFANVGDAILRASGIASRIAKRESDLEELDRVDEAVLDTLKREFHERGESAAPGFDPSPIEAIDPEFSAESFLVIARDTFRVVQAARSQSDPSLAADAVDAGAVASLVGALAPATDTRGDVASIDIVSAKRRRDRWTRAGRGALRRQRRTAGNRELDISARPARRHRHVR